MNSSKTRETLQTDLQRYGEKDLEERHRAGYRKMPPEPGEFNFEEEDRAWDDEAWTDG